MNKLVKKRLAAHFQQLAEWKARGVDVKLLTPEEKKVTQRIKKQTRKAKLVKVHVDATPYKVITTGPDSHIDYYLNVSKLFRFGEEFYLEEMNEIRQIVLKHNKIMSDQEKHRNVTVDVKKQGRSAHKQQPLERTGTYNRLKAVQYAERWWNEYNPDYPEFTDNCTNFISQCLHAGGAPMHGLPVRDQGWWWRGENWSYSWAVAHSLRWYLSGSTKGLTAKEVERAEDLRPGDIICYDFDGSGRWDHNTIVVRKDNERQPLVNAQTANSRNRFWKYEDSTAWTEDIKYKFFAIHDQFS
ncbi:hypothetical protein DH09_09000 [Bacillaceae bacterium JMAK1]|nr:hypothetical protein DH09_09000 [Bacillaceae bacterium JMAK1]